MHLARYVYRIVNYIVPTCLDLSAWYKGYLDWWGTSVGSCQVKGSK